MDTSFGMLDRSIFSNQMAAVSNTRHTKINQLLQYLGFTDDLISDVRPETYSVATEVVTTKTTLVPHLQTNMNLF